MDSPLISSSEGKTLMFTAFMFNHVGNGSIHLHVSRPQRKKRTATYRLYDLTPERANRLAHMVANIPRQQLYWWPALVGGSIGWEVSVFKENRP